MLASDDIVGHEECEPVWTNGLFRLLEMQKCKDVAVLGAGWYRLEDHPASPYLWQRRMRWLRKRAELLIVNASDGPKRLAFFAAAGYGSSKVTRELNLYVDRRLLQQIEIDGSGRYLTKPFRTTERLAQVEFEVVENARPISRNHAFWFRWIPRDPRLTNVGFSSIRLYGLGQPILPTVKELDFSDQRTFRQIISNGVYQDRWVGNRATITLQSGKNSPASIRVEGVLPDVKSFHLPCTLAFSWDDEFAGVSRLDKSGAFEVAVPLPTAPSTETGLHTVTITPTCTFSPAQLGTGPDMRTLSVQLSRLYVR